MTGFATTSVWFVNMAGAKDKFCLKWNDFEANISKAFRQLREDKDFFDVTLVCDEDQIQAHKVILSACSPFFRRVLQRNKHEHPLLYLKGVKQADLVSVLSFMYHGEVDISQEDLNSFLSVAQDLKVKGLTEKAGEPTVKQGAKERKQPPLPTFETNRKLTNPLVNKLKSNTEEDPIECTEIEEIQPVTMIKTEPETVVPTTLQSFASSASSSYAMINAVQNDDMVDDFGNYDDTDHMYGMGDTVAYTPTGENKNIKQVVG